MSLQQKHLDDILTEMFKQVDRDYSPEIVKQEDWFRTSEWSSSTENTFRKWLTKYLTKKFKYRAEYADKQAGWFIFCYGWRTKSE